MEKQKKKILFVGAGGEVASMVLPSLAETYDIVGIAGKRDTLRQYCVEMYSGDLFSNYATLFETALRAHTFDVIVWNPVKYLFTSLMGSTREGLHREFDLAVALPIECVRSARKVQDFKGNFILVSSLSAFNYREDLATYSIVKNAQIRTAEVLSLELEGSVAAKVVAPSTVRYISSEELTQLFKTAIEDTNPQKIFYKIEKE
ncbi:hypothetical protein A2419_00810 [Candidatus Adlerbacteria bacterium RIFOXYC1_FULL_48_26]|uniref:Short-chain dehydrogenase n=1 Tax=Candidatus Adlerbacteria bacterium RIFOXYC1_FULL_48_26 TaxID=1797247 RepID=A0A1F4Y3V6_9BACT|nr:MAG: hypothetical protein A2419_00810 [Candidatus Adlerbacteria bacterium RIFOXYC1_FULL_48_26]OGC96448.1 MAG: hypothetical protein A2590_02845 [Candidatus Adlerbacteria bacterium RIFOXYD1_FULL_48_8]